MHEERLFRLAHAGLGINAYFEHGQGWRLVVRARRADEAWTDTEPVFFDCLSTSEMADTLCAWVHHELGLD